MVTLMFILCYVLIFMSIKNNVNFKIIIELKINNLS
jgi:hypothetical protein